MKWIEKWETHTLYKNFFNFYKTFPSKWKRTLKLKKKFVLYCIGILRINKVSTYILFIWLQNTFLRCNKGNLFLPIFLCSFMEPVLYIVKYYSRIKHWEMYLGTDIPENAENCAFLWTQINNSLCKFNNIS